VNAIPDMDKCSEWNLDRSLNTEQALKDVYNKKKLYSAIGLPVPLSHRLREGKGEESFKYCFLTIY